MRICLLSYRGNPYSGGQGIYIHYLSRELCRLGHEVHLLAGPPYPEVVSAVKVHRLRSLQLYDSLEPLRSHLPRLRNPLRLYEFLATCAGTFPEPFTFSIRAYRKLQELLSSVKFDIVHDNQCLGYGLLLMKRLRVPVIATIHHPITVDRKLAFAQTENQRDRFRLMRWYSFIMMQRRVAPRLEKIITVSHSSARDIERSFKVYPNKLRVVHNGVDTDFFRSDNGISKRPNSIIAMDSGTGHMKGIPYLLQALRLLRENEDGNVNLTVVGTSAPGTKYAMLIREWGLEDAVTFTGRITKQELVRRYSTAEIAAVPSLYEGFGFPAVEAMSCKLPVIATRAGALPEVVGEDGRAGILVPPADSEALAAAIRHLLHDRQLRKSMGEAGRQRVEELFSWEKAAQETLQVYQELL